jgi:hypothetical protein
MSLNVVVENGSRMVKPMKERYGRLGSKQKLKCQNKIARPCNSVLAVLLVWSGALKMG